MIEHGKNIVNRIYFNSFNHRRFIGIFGGNKNFTDSALTCPDNHRQHTVDPANLTVKRKLAEEDISVRVGSQLFRRHKQSNKHCKVIERALLSAVGRGKINGNSADRKIKAAVLYRGMNTVSGLADSGIGQAYHIKTRQARGYISLNADRENLHAENAHTVDLCKHSFILFR